MSRMKASARSGPSGAYTISICSTAPSRATYGTSRRTVDWVLSACRMSRFARASLPPASPAVPPISSSRVRPEKLQRASLTSPMRKVFPARTQSATGTGASRKPTPRPSAYVPTCECTPAPTRHMLRQTCVFGSLFCFEPRIGRRSIAEGPHLGDQIALEADRQRETPDVVGHDDRLRHDPGAVLGDVGQADAQAGLACADASDELAQIRARAHNRGIRDLRFAINGHRLGEAF